MALADIFESGRRQEELCQHIDNLYQNARRGIFIGSHGQDFRTEIKYGSGSNLLLQANGRKSLLSEWMEIRKLTFDQLQWCLDNPEKAPPLPESLETELADIQMLKEVMVRKRTIMDVSINPVFKYPHIMFEFSLKGKVYVSLWLRIGRTGLNNGNCFIIIDEMQGAKTEKDYYGRLEKRIGIHPFSLAILSLIQAVQQLRNHQWKIVRDYGIGFFPKLTAEIYFDSNEAIDPSTGKPLSIGVDNKNAWEGYSVTRSPLYGLKEENKTIRKESRKLAGAEEI
ncbi:hypothetical protein A3B60_01310 [Candidatus Peregrinibacteria bacterium RIFCSPLOWO2_01_FULL_39_12]|nr:MAG: hypothetical protein A3B60_01310 [Candidatus Peregrinibacteria bacterium RIFCSPLOWO2_01_FULL_39_12]